MFDLIGLGAGKMTDDDLFHAVIAHCAVSPTPSKIYLQMLLRISSRLTAQHTLSLFLTPFCHLDQTLALPRACIFTELGNKGAAGKASPGSRLIRSLTSPNDEATSL